MTGRPTDRMATTPSLGIRWTIGDVSANGFAALQLSLWGARRAFGEAAALCVVVNSVTLEDARARTGPVPDGIVWRVATAVPAVLRAHLEPGMAEGVAWKFAPLRCFPERFELALDNDCLLWEVPTAIRRWLAAGPPHGCLMAEDVRRCLGQFDDVCGPHAYNSGIRGLPPHFDLEASLAQVLARRPVMLRSELDEQGLQTAALALAAEPSLVSVEEVSICSPFWPHRPHLGTHGAHFVGLNARSLPWSYEGRPAVDCIAQHWQKHLPTLVARVGLQATRVQPVD